MIHLRILFQRVAHSTEEGKNPQCQNDRNQTICLDDKSTQNSRTNCCYQISFGSFCENSEMGKTAKRLTKEQKELTTESIRTLTAKYEELVGKASAKAASHIDHHRFLDDLLWGLRLVAMALPTVLVLLLSVFMGWLQL